LLIYFQIGCSHRDPVKVPFILLPNSQNEGQFAFSVESINIPQKLKGTLTYMEKVGKRHM
jgi:AP-3 complex subunit delta-1